MNDDGQNGDDAADGQRARVAHENLGGIGVIPQETDERTDHSADVNHEFLRARDVHDV